MRIGVTIPPECSFDDVAALVSVADTEALDAVYLPLHARRSAQVLAAALATVSHDILILIEVDCSSHPVHLLEEVAVLDLLHPGRLAVVLAAGTQEQMTTFLSLLSSSGGGNRSFRSVRPESDDGIGIDPRITATPAPANIGVPYFVLGSENASVAESFALPVIARQHDTAETMTDLWSQFEDRLGSGANYMRRSAIRSAVVGEAQGLEAAETVKRLTIDRDSWLMDLCLVDLSTFTDRDAQRQATCDIGRGVRPRLQIHELPMGLAEWWDQRRLAGEAEPDSDVRGRPRVDRRAAAVIANYFDYMNRELWEEFAELWHDDATMTAVGSRPLSGRAEVLAFYRRLFDAWESHTDRPTRIIDSDGTTVVEVRFEGRSRDGAVHSFDAVDVFDVSDGRILRLSNWYDLDRVRRLMRGKTS